MTVRFIHAEEWLVRFLFLLFLLTEKKSFLFVLAFSVLLLTMNGISMESKDSYVSFIGIVPSAGKQEVKH